MAGDPSLDATDRLVHACARGGADVVELGVPFSDPIADGPEIQQASQRALRAGTRTKDVLSLVSRLRDSSDLPLVLMTYLNPVLALGVDAFADRATKAGVDGVILPDLSLEESEEIRRVFDARGLDHIQLVAPSTPEERAKRIGEASRGFLYVVARYGTTGARAELPVELSERLRVLRRVTTLPLAVGFGVSMKSHVHSLVSMGVDGVVVGSAIVRRAAEDPDPERIEGFVRELASGLHGP